jgi:OPT family oligopeptide transporter
MSTAPQTPAAVDTPEMRWLTEVYRPHEPQLTVRAVVTGMLLGMLMCLSNLYVVLKTGWSIGVTVTACIMAYGIFGIFKGVGLVKKPFGILENNAMGSVASAAGYMTGGGNMAALPALVMLTGIRPDTTMMIFWFAAIAALGVCAAIPIKRQLVNQEQLAFPTGTATAETLRALHAHGPGSGNKAKLLGYAGLVGAVIAFWRDANLSWIPWRLPSVFPWPFSIRGKPAGDFTLGFEGSLMMLGVGALMSWRTGWSLLLGALVLYGGIAPWLFDTGVLTTVSYKAIVGWSVWLGAGILVSSGLTAFAFQWKSVSRSVVELVALLKKKKAGDAADPMAEVECPPSWFPLGFMLLGPVVVFLGWYLFQIPWWAGVIALPLAVIMGTIAARVTGETDITPTKALGPVTQLIFGGLLPRQLVPNLMGANITGGVGLHAADLLTALKSGYLLGARPRPQFLGQMFGVLAGAAIVMPAFNLLIPDASHLGGAEFPAPGAQVWAGVSKMLSEGWASLHITARWGAAIGVSLGTALALVDQFAPKQVKTFVPSASGLGIALVIPGFNSIMMFIGSGLAELYRRKKGAKEGDDTIVPVASGFIAGESIVGIVIKMLVAFSVLPK